MYSLLITKPFYNAFIYLIGSLPFFDAGAVIVIFTVLVKLLLLPLSIKASKTQIKMKGAEKDLEAIKRQYKDNKEEQAKKTMEYYKEKGINPFAGFLILIIQLPIIIGLYQVFLKSGLPQINTSLLYSFIPEPTVIKMFFLGIINISTKNIWLAIIAGLTTYFQISMSSPVNKTSQSKDTKTEFMQIMNTQMKFVFPIMVIFISYKISAALALYWITSNVFAIAQEWYVKKKYHKSVSVI